MRFEPVYDDLDCIFTDDDAPYPEGKEISEADFDAIREGYDDEYVMQHAQHSRTAEFPLSESDPDVDHHTYRSDDDRQNRIVPEFLSD